MRSCFNSLILALLLSFVLTSCGLQQINVNRTTPSSPGKYPEFTAEDSLRGGLGEFRSNFDVHHYSLRVDFNLAKKYIKGEVDITFEALKDLEKIQLDLFENMNINEVVFEGSKLEYQRLYNAFFVSFSRKIAKGSQVKLTVKYEGSPVRAKKPPWEGGFVWEEYDSKPWVGVACEVLGASSWWPLKDHLSDEPDSMDLYYTIPSDLYCVGNGSLAGIENKGERSTYHWRVANPINSYNVTFYIGDYVTIDVPYDKGSDLDKLTYCVHPGNKEKALAHFKQTEGIVAFFEKAFGPFPWGREGFKLVESPYEGMEHQSAIAYGHGFQNHPYGFDHIILHEAAHEWWGNALSVPDYAEIWLHEGFATYSEALYVEEKYGRDKYMSYMGLYGMLIQNKFPVVRTKHVNFWNYRDTDVYLKGAQILHSLRFTIDNDSLFFSILKTFNLENRKRIVTSEDFILLVNRLTGGDYRWFFDQYLYRRESPMLLYDLKYDREKRIKVLHFKWADVEENFKMPVMIKDGAEWVRITPTINESTYVLKASETDFGISMFYNYFCKVNKKL